VTATIVAVLMWILVACLIVLRRGRTERNVTYAALAIAFAMTLNVDWIYRGLDGFSGGSNLVTLVADLTLMVGVFFLGRGVMRAFEYRPRLVRIALSRTALVAALASEIGAFLLIERGTTTTTFMLDLGSQLAAASYSSIQFAYYGIILAAMGVLAARQVRRSERTLLLMLPPVFLVAGSALGILLSLSVFAMDVAHVVGDLNLMSAVSVTYSPLFFSTFLFLCAGFAGGPAARAAQEAARERQARKFVADLTPLWVAATRQRPGISQNAALDIRREGSEAWLHRQAVEIRDAMIDTRVSFEIGSQDRLLLERVEDHLLGSGPNGRSTSALDATARQGKRSP
jgi:hypothetical protein